MVEGVAGDESKCVVVGGREQVHIVRINNLNGAHPIASFAWVARARLKPLDLDAVTLLDGFQRTKPTGAVAGENKVSWLPEVCSAIQTRRAEG